MKTLKYKKDEKEFVKEVRADVKKYFTNKGIEPYGGSEIFFKTVLMAWVYFVPYGVMLSGTITNVGLILLCWVLMGLGMSGIGLVTMHDANHGAFSKHKWVNRLFGNSLYLLGGFPANWKYQHNTLHHGYTNIEGYDEDIAHGGIMRFSPHKPLRAIHKYQYIYAWFFYGLMTFSWVTLKDFNKLSKYRKEGVVLGNHSSYLKLYTQMIGMKIIYYVIFLALPILFIPLAWYWVLLGFLIMHFTSGLILAVIFQSAHVVPSSEYPLPDSESNLDYNWLVHQLHTTSDFAPSRKLFSWLIGGLNYQVVHHLFPNISHVHYKNLAKIIKEKAGKYHLPYHVNNTFVGAVYQHALMLKMLGAQITIKTPRTLLQGSSKLLTV